MNEVVDYLKKSNTQYFATIGLDGKPKVRPFHFMFEEEGKLWFCTSNQKKVYKEIQNNPYIELCASGEIMSWIRLSGKVVFSDNIEIKEKVFEVNPIVKGIYKDPGNPEFEVFYLEDASASINEIGKSPLIYNL
jgi:uncharacterized pyridoxamine 5'-phosphate oxidase family protein